MAEENNFLGKILLDGFPAAPAGVGEFDLCFDIDANGIPNVTAGQKKVVRIK